MSIRRTTITAIAVLIGWMTLGTVQAAPIDCQQALQAARQFVTPRGKTITSTHPRALAPSHPRTSMADEAAYYVFDIDNKGGFVIVAGDDSVEPVIGYVEHGSFDADNMPDAMRWFLETFEESVNRGYVGTKVGGYENTTNANLAPSHPSTPAPSNTNLAPPYPRTPAPSNISPRNTPARHTVEPLLQTLWNQGNPYNILCPRYLNGDGTEGDHSATGCVATAIAQVMGFYRYPAETQRYIPSYECEFETDDGKVKKRIDGISPHSVIDWDNILNEYNGQSTARQDTAIAQLMLYVGVGCKMGYGPSSGAGFSEGVNALINYFGYDDGTRIEQRGKYTIQGWSDLLYTELATGHPIAFAGTNSGGAHAFVIDGYDMSGLFHLNWGWGGLDNGYFRIDALAPDDNSGIGASLTPDGYNMGQEAIIGLRLPDDEKADPVQPQLSVNDWELRNGNRFFANFVNWSGVASSWDMGIAYKDTEGEWQLVGTKRTSQISNNYYVGQEFVISGLQPGTYHVVPVSKRSSQKAWQTQVNPDIRYILVEVDADGNVATALRPIEDISLDELTFPGSHKVNERQSVQAIFSNHGDEYSREIHLLAGLVPRAADGNVTVEHICRTQVTIAEDGQTVSAFYFEPNQTGTWLVRLSTDYDGHNIVGEGTVEITADGVAQANNLRYVSHTVTNRSNGAIYGNRMQGKVTIMNQGDEAFDGMVRLWLFRLADDGYYYGANSTMVPLHIESKKTAQAAYDFDHLDLNTTYTMSILYQQGGDIQDGGLKQMGRTQAGIVYWQQNRTMSGAAPTNSFNVPSGAVAVDMSSAGNGVKSVRPNANPNTIYILPVGGQKPTGLDERNVVVGDECEELTLTDDYGFWSPVTFTAQQAVYTRETTAGWETIALPFSVDDLPPGVVLKEFTEQTAGQTPTFDTSHALARNIPYIIYSKVGGSQLFEATDVRISSTNEAPMIVGTDDYHFIGATLSTTFNPGEIYVFDGESGCFSLISERTTIKPFRAYIVGYIEEGMQPSQFDVDTAIPTALPMVTSDTATPQGLYDLQGRRINGPYGKGVYIFNGRKVVVK